MTRLKLIAPALLTVLLMAGASRPAFAQNATATDIERLQDALSDASRSVDELRARDGALASQLQKELDELGEEAIYLKVKIRKNQVVPRSDYYDLRDRIDTVRSRSRRETPRSTTSTSPTPSTSASTSGANRSPTDVPVGTELDVRLQQSLSSGTALVEDRFEATTMVDLRKGDRIVIPAGSTMRGVISSVNKAGRVERKGSMTLAFDQVTIGGHNYPIKGTVTDAIESAGIKGEVPKIGAGAGVGAIIGGILGGVKGAIAGILIGGGGTIAATEGKDVELPAGTVLRVRLDSGLDLR